jgi:hypothetical protein
LTVLVFADYTQIGFYLSLQTLSEKSSHIIFSSRSEGACDAVCNFYREEFSRCQCSLEAQREYYSKTTIEDIERVLILIMDQLDSLYIKRNTSEVLDCLLHQFNVVTGSSAWSEPRQVN